MTAHRYHDQTPMEAQNVDDDVFGAAVLLDPSRGIARLAGFGLHGPALD
jgi:hypothetical protein